MVSCLSQKKGIDLILQRVVHTGSDGQHAGSDMCGWWEEQHVVELAPMLKIPQGCLCLEEGAILHTGTVGGRNFKRKGGSTMHRVLRILVIALWVGALALGTAAAAEMKHQGEHAMSGTVTDIDPQTGKLS